MSFDREAAVAEVLKIWGGNFERLWRQKVPPTKRRSEHREEWPPDPTLTPEEYKEQYLKKYGIPEDMPEALQRLLVKKIRPAKKHAG